MKDVFVQVGSVWYIDPIRFLQLLQDRVSLIADRIAVPGTDHPTTEALRGRRGELITLIQQLTESTNVKRP